MNQRAIVKAAVLAGLILATAGCNPPVISTSGVAKGHPSPSPQVTPSPSPSPSPSSIPSPSPSPSPETAVLPNPPAPQPLACRIAVFGYQAGSGGFVTLPSGDFSVDAKSNIAVPAGANSGYQGGFGGSSYDYAKRRWLPVQQADVSPDGSTYTYRGYESDGGIYVVDAVTGGSRNIATGSFWQVVAFGAPGVYAMRLDPSIGIYHGLYIIDSNSGAARGLTAHGVWQAIGKHAAWGTEFATPGGPDTSHAIIRFDLTSGQLAVYFSQPGSNLSVVGFDEQDRPLIDSSNDVAQQIWALNGPGRADRIYSGPGNVSKDYLRISPPGINDTHGIWFGTNQGLMLYTTTDGFKKMSFATGQVGGGCH